MRPQSLHGHLLACFAGAAIDNVFRMGVQAALAVAATSEAKAQELNLWVMVLFTVPFLLLAPTAGSLGDRLPKHLLIRSARLVDLLICSVGVYGICTHSVPLMLATIGLLATVSAIFAPVKLAVVPELVPDHGLSRANGLLAGTTVVAILAGMGLAGFSDHGLALAGITAVLCLAGVVGAWMIPALPARDPQAPIAAPWSLGRQFRVFGSAKGLWAPAWSLGGFWALGSAASTCLAPMLKAQGIEGAQPLTILVMSMAGGLVAGSLAAPLLIVRAYPAGLPIAGALISGGAMAATGWLAHHHASMTSFAIALGLAGLGGGLWEVPVTVLLQERAPADRRNLVMGGVTIISSLTTIALVGGLLPLTSLAHLDSAGVMMVIGGGTVVLALTLAWHWRLAVAAWAVCGLARLLWRLRRSGQPLPAGSCLIVANHLSYADGIALAATLERPVRFLVYRRFFSMPVIGFLLRAIGAIPVAAEDGRRALMASIDAAVAALQAGEVVAIFPEGKLTRSGGMDRFKSGMERIASRAAVPVVPVHLDGLEGTWMSRCAYRDRPRLRRTVLVRVGTALDSAVTAAAARQAVCALGAEQAQAAADHEARTLAMAAVRLLRRHPRTIGVRDAQGVLSNWQIIAIARALRSRLGLTADERHVGVVLPPGRAGTLVNLALAMDGRTAINLNHTAGDAAVARMAELAGLRTVISAGPYLKRIGEPVLPDRVVLVEHLLPTLGKATVLLHAVLGMLLPSRWWCRGSAQDPAAIVFSSGSTGDPKGAVLTHAQILANCRAVHRGLGLHPYADGILTPLPLFHSFGLIPGMWLGLTHGLSITAHPDPTDGATIGRLAEQAGATFLISTPTFVRGWMRRIEPQQFRTLRLAVVGAERCPTDLKEAFKERYGCDLLEGYGCTELAPTVSANLPDVRRDGEIEVRSKDGSVGRPLPGLHAFTIDPDTRCELPPDREGLIVVRSPSRMRGYLLRDDLTAAAFHGDGYITGDIGRVDEDGFIFITGRLARFAKIGGEMVPLDRVENTLVNALMALDPAEGAELAVAAVPDAQRGERLVVLANAACSGIDWPVVFAAADALPSLWRPRIKELRHVAAIPRLGTGKRDLAGVKALAAQRMDGTSA